MRWAIRDESIVEAQHTRHALAAAARRFRPGSDRSAGSAARDLWIKARSPRRLDCGDDPLAHRNSAMASLASRS
jgi:hypothetical protein